MANPALIAKAVAAVVSDERLRKGVGWILVAIFAPVIVVIALLCSLGTGAVDQNISIVELCFNGGTIPDGIPEECRVYIEDMQSSLSLLDGYIAEINEQAEDGASLDAIRVKAIFYALYFGADAPGSRAHLSFADCFVTYEERIRTAPETDGDESSEEPEETYTVAVPIDDMDVVYSNLASALGIEITEEQKANADSIYNLIRYGYAGAGGGWSGELGDIVVSVDGFVSPLGSGWQARVTSEFGYRRDPFTGEWAGHTGMDMAVPTGTPVRAALDGTVTVSTYNAGGYGYYVMIDHGGGLATLYGHCSQLLVSVGRVVQAGDIIALSGSTGRSTGPHLHLEVRVNGERQNPRYYLP